MCPACKMATILICQTFNREDPLFNLFLIYWTQSCSKYNFRQEMATATTQLWSHTLLMCRVYILFKNIRIFDKVCKSL